MDGPRLISRKEAAAYLGISVSTFTTWVMAGHMPGPVFGSQRWDIRALDARVDEESGLRSHRHSPSIIQNDAARDDERELQEWLSKQRERDKFKPKYRLNVRQERILRFMIANPTYVTVDLIPEAGDVSMEALKQIGLVTADGISDEGRRLWSISDDGKEQIELTDIWINWKK